MSVCVSCRGAQFSTKEDGEVVENLTQTQLDPSKHRIIPSAGKSFPSLLAVLSTGLLQVPWPYLKILDVTYMS